MKILTAGIHGALRGLKFEPDLSAPACPGTADRCNAQAGAEIGQISADFERGLFEIDSI